jgi:NAD-dependent SIR2 family protein deacetylase
MLTCIHCGKEAVSGNVLDNGMVEPDECIDCKSKRLRGNLINYGQYALQSRLKSRELKRSKNNFKIWKNCFFNDTK